MDVDNGGVDQIPLIGGIADDIGHSNTYSFSIPKIKNGANILADDLMIKRVDNGASHPWPMDESYMLLPWQDDFDINLIPDKYKNSPLMAFWTKLKLINQQCFFCILEKMTC